VRAVTIVSNAFLELATAQARMRGVDELPVVVVTHPVGGLLPDELVIRVLEASGAIERSFAKDRDEH
jgi:hypothetical protein